MWRFRISLLNVLVGVAVLAVFFAIKVYKDRDFRAYCLASAQPHLDAAAESYRQEAKLLSEARNKTGIEADFLKHNARIARLWAQNEEKIAAELLKDVEPVHKGARKAQMP